ncbi:hypothetical protein BDZ90DRAFT_229754 [Jaminaea rosea]|uniref:Uncharacterized protein n=1 Tax=Jaminaea rosea TaxID=1569628 RepID=A0A316UZN0_9BASI|nr:hypothetical protein BDZ90DRAFT_229754 [Jaminaea rosea]PWN30759.1 hypothetical protein BDZ90DRAFT_229754 [Jaminaea rosea]
MAREQCSRWDEQRLLNHLDECVVAAAAADDDDDDDDGGGDDEQQENAHGGRGRAGG